MAFLQRNTNNQLKCDAVVIGWGLTGQSVARFLLKKGVNLVAMDTRKKPPQSKENLENMTRLIKGEIDHDFLEISQQIIISPGIGKADLGFDIIARYGAKVIGDIELFAQSVEAPVIAITGTNGKTSVANFVRQIWSLLDYKSVNIGTNGVDGDYNHDVKLTTPEPLILHNLLDKLAKKNISHCSMEASSHGLSQHRLDAVTLSAAAFTNFSHDHLDYHETFDAYFEAKMRLFEVILNKNGTAVIFMDQEKGKIVKNRCEHMGLSTFTIGKGDNNDIVIEKVNSDEISQTVRFRHRNYHYQFRVELVGRFQVDNVLVAVGLAIVLGEDIDKVTRLLSRLKPVPGRMQLVGLRKNRAPIFVDYAHTPDALKNALISLRQHVLGRLIVIFGAGGDRDKDKRVLMGRVASKYADSIYVTDDNPRGENPQSIRKAILDGCNHGVEIGDRAEAIIIGVSKLKEGDALLIAGKGHETNQVIGDTVFPFNDIEQASMAIEILDGKKNGSLDFL